MNKKKTSEAQLKATRNWEAKNPERTKKMRYLRNSRTFFRHHATDDDIKELLQIYKKENKNSKNSIFLKIKLDNI